MFLVPHEKKKFSKKDEDKPTDNHAESKSDAFLNHRYLPVLSLSKACGLNQSGQPYGIRPQKTARGIDDIDNPAMSFTL